MKKYLLIGILQLTSLLAFAQQKQIQYLSGMDAANTVQWDFFCTAGRNSGEWKKIQVPSCWEQQGYGNYNYGRDYKTNGRMPGFMMKRGCTNIPSKYRPPGKASR